MKEALAEVGYLADEPAALVSFLAQRLGKPILVEGPAGVGKTELAKALSRATGRELVRLQCYEGLDEAKAMYEWNYRKQLLRIQAGGEGGWDDVQEDIFGTEFLLTRPLMQAISSPEPVVLLIDEIDKTDQEFEAMLLELLSDFQITIPELGQISATTMPIVVLTSNDSRELTEALKRRCLYLWLDYPGIEREMEIVLLHAPELPRDAGPAAGRGDRDGPRPRPEEAALDRRVDRLGADPAADGRRRHRPRDLRHSMSIIVKHRTDIDLVAERVGMKLPEPQPRRWLEPGLATASSKISRGPRGRAGRRRRGGRRGSPTQRSAAAITSGRWVETTIAAPAAGSRRGSRRGRRGSGVEAVEGLVGEQDLEGAHQGEGDRGLLPHALGEFGAEGVLPARRGRGGRSARRSAPRRPRRRAGRRRIRGARRR